MNPYLKVNAARLTLLSVGLLFLFGCSSPSSTDSSDRWDPKREILSYAILGDTAIDFKLYAYDIERKGASESEIHNQTISFIRIRRQSGSVSHLASLGINPAATLAVKEDPHLPDFLYHCSEGDIHSGRFPSAQIPPFQCNGDAIAASAGGLLTAFPTKVHGVLVFDTTLTAVLELPLDTILELDPIARTASTFVWGTGNTANWRSYGISSQGVMDSAQLIDPVLVDVEGIGTRIACSDEDVAAAKAPCLALAGVNGLRQTARVHCRSKQCEWLPSLGRLAILESGNRFRFLEPSTASSETYDAGELLLRFDPRE